jgi:hypothetical protein
MFEPGENGAGENGSGEHGAGEHGSGSAVLAGDLVGRLRSVIAELEAADPGSLVDMDSVRDVVIQANRLDGIVSGILGAFRARGDWADTGAKDPGSWLAVQARLPLGEARRRFNLARRLRFLPHTRAAWSAGEISENHASRLAGLRNDRTAEALERDEAMLVSFACELRYDHWARVVSAWESLADPDGTEESYEQRRQRRDVYLVRTLDEMYLGRMSLDPVSGAIVAARLELIEKELFETDWAEAKARMGGNVPQVTDLARTPAQRRADALVEMAIRAGVAPPDGIRPAPLFTVMVDYPSLVGRVCELASGASITPGALVPWLEQAYIERAVFSPSGRVEVSRRARLFSGATLRALRIRDRAGCTHPYCFTPAARCQADHVIPYSEGGLTTQENGRLVCGTHNRARNHRPDPPRWRSRFGEPEVPGEDLDQDGADPDPPPRVGPEADPTPPGRDPGEPGWQRPPPPAA